MNSNSKIYDSVETTIEVLVSNVFDVLSLDKNGYDNISKDETIKIISIMDTIFEGNTMLSLGKITKEDVYDYTSSNYDYKSICKWFTEIATTTFSNRDGLQEEVSRAFANYEIWKNKYFYSKSDQKNVKIEVEQEKSKSFKELNLEKEIIKLKKEIKKLQIENKELRYEIENLRKNNLTPKRNFSNSQIQSIKNMNTHGISTRLIAMEFNCSIEDIKNVIDE